MRTKEQIDEYRRRMEAFNRWEAVQPPMERAAAANIADLGFLLTLISPEDRLRDPDPRKLGVQRMRQILALVGRSR